MGNNRFFFVFKPLSNVYVIKTKQLTLWKIGSSLFPFKKRIRRICVIFGTLRSNVNSRLEKLGFHSTILIAVFRTILLLTID